MEVNVIFKTNISNIITKSRYIAHWWSKNSTIFVAIAWYKMFQKSFTELNLPRQQIREWDNKQQWVIYGNPKYHPLNVIY